MLFYLFSPRSSSAIFDRLGYEFDGDFVARNIEYYGRGRSHGSTLSSMVQAWIPRRLDRRRSWDLLRSALLGRHRRRARGHDQEGIHLGAMAGTVDLVQRCYAGIETRDEVLYLNPVLPDQLHELRFTIRYRGHQVALRISQAEVFARVGDDRDGDGRPILIDVRGERHRLVPGGAVSVRLREAGA